MTFRNRNTTASRGIGYLGRRWGSLALAAGLTAATVLIPAGDADAVTTLQQQIANKAYTQDGMHNHYGPDEDWCSLFAGWVWNQTDGNLPGPQAGSAYWINYGQSHGTLHTDPRVGDLVVYGWNGVYGSGAYAAHVGIVLKVKGSDTIDEMDGNFEGSGAYPTQTSVVYKAEGWHPKASGLDGSGAPFSYYVSAFPDAD